MTLYPNHHFSPRAQDEVLKCTWCEHPKNAHMPGDVQPNTWPSTEYKPIKYLPTEDFQAMFQDPNELTEFDFYTKAPEPDSIHSPNHYVNLSPEPLDVIEAWGLSFHEGNIIKYVARWRNKGGIEDLKKAREYLDRLIVMQERK